jgi:hypothetical protein
MAINIFKNGHKIYRHLQQKGPPKFTQIGIFCLKTNHLATLFMTHTFLYPGHKDLGLLGT